MLRKRYYLLVASVFLLFNSSYADTSPCDFNEKRGYIILDSSMIRMENREECFQREYKIIYDRRKSFSTVKLPGGNMPDQIIGLGLSGGGIKSSSFQLGMLSGLYNAENRNGSPLLNEIDYISSVSGGSWASGAYIASGEPDGTFFDCLDDIAAYRPSKEACEEMETILPRKQSKIWGSRDWQEQIVMNFLRGKDIKMENLRRQGGPLFHRPFPVFLSTHSNTIIGQKSVKNFPFEITPLSIGAVADCDSPETPCGFFRRYLRPLHWNNPPEKGFFIDLEEGIDIKVRKYSSNTDEKLYLSHAMWSSGGLLAKIFSLHLRLDREGEKLEGIRKKYVLSDGGKTDNIGLIPLVERGTDLIILSQIASDSKIGFGDLKRAAAQVKRLFAVDVDVDGLVSPHLEDKKKKPFVTSSCIKKDDADIAAVLFIKPTQENVRDFYDYLKTSGKHGEILGFLEETQMTTDKAMRFPQNNTIKLKYPEKLIYAYYLLGRYIGEFKLSPLINSWLDHGLNMYGKCSA